MSTILKVTRYLKIATMVHKCQRKSDTFQIVKTLKLTPTSSSNLRLTETDAGCVSIQPLRLHALQNRTYYISVFHTV